MAATASALASASQSLAATDTWTGATDSYWGNANWTPAAPTFTDIASFNALSTANLATSLSGPTSILGLQITSPSGPVSISNSTLTIGSCGIDMSVAAQPLTINSSLTLAADAGQIWNATSGQALTLQTGTFTRSAGAALNVQGSGTVVTTMPGLTTSSLSNGIIGPWASFGSGASLSYATINGSNQIIAYTGATAAAAGAFGGTSATTNYDFTGGGNFTAGGNRAANTIRSTGAATSFYSSGTTRSLTINAIMNGGTGALTFGGNGSGTVNIAIGSTSELIVTSNSQNVSIFNAISNNGTTPSGLTFNSTSAGTLTLNGTNTFTGLTSIDGGTVYLTSAGALGGGGSVSFGGGALEFSASNTTDNSALILNSSGAIAINPNAQTVTFGSALSSTNTGGLSVVGAGTLVLTGANLYSGVTTINAGTLQVGNGGTTGSLGSGSVVTNAALAFNLTGATTVSNAISGTGSLSTNGSGTLSLSGSNSYFGATAINAGTLQVANVNALQNSTVTASANNDLIFGTGIISATLGGLSGAGSLTATNFDGNAVALTVGNNNATTTYSGVLGGLGSLNKVGTGTLTISASNTYAGNTTISGGTLILGNGTSFTTGGIGGGSIIFQGGTLSSSMSSSNTLEYAAANPISVASGQTGTMITPNRFQFDSAVSGAGTLNINIATSAGRADFQNEFSGFTGTVNLTGSGTARLGVNPFTSQPTFDAAGWAGTTLSLDGVTIAPNTNTIGNTISIGALTSVGATGVLGASTTGGAATYSIGAKNLNTTYGGTIAGNSALAKLGSGSLTLTGASTYTGVTTVSAGTLALTDSINATVLGASSQVTVSGGGTAGTGVLTLISSSSTPTLIAYSANLAINDSVTFGSGTSTSALVNLNFSGIEQTLQLVIDGHAMGPGLYGASAIDTDSDFAGAGELQVAPEPATLSLLGIGAIGLVGRRRRRAR